MSTELQTRPTTTTLVPKVNLLPPEIGQAARLRAVKVQLGAGILATVGVVGLLFVVASGQVTSAEEAFADAQAATAKTQQEVAALSGVTATYAQVAAAQAQLTMAMGGEVRWSQFLTDLSIQTPSTVSLTSVSVSQGSPAEAAASAGAAGATATVADPTIATVTFQGEAVAQNDLARFLDKLAAQHNQVNAYYTKGELADSTTYDALTWGFDAQTAVESSALSNRYTEGGQ